MNIVIPMAGAGQRFKNSGYRTPKPFILAHGEPMVYQAIESLGLEGKYYMIYSPSVITQGAVNTVLLLEKTIDTEEELIIMNCDQKFEWDKKIGNVDGAILTFKAKDPKWSFAEVEDGLIVKVAEKVPISDNATVGVYYWKYGSDFVKYARRMIAKNMRVNGEFYVCPVYNEAIADGKRIIPIEVHKMWGLGTPKDLEEFNG